MVAASPSPPIRIARAALFVVFGLNGLLSAIWIVHIPAVSERTGVSHSLLGMLILLMAASAIVGMQTAGPLADRLGSRTLTATAATLLSLTLPGLAFATSPLTLALALVAYGFGNGMLDVSMNAQAVQVERAYARPIMAAFHALFSLGGLAGSLAGAAAQRADWNIHTTFLAASGFGLVMVAVCAPRLLAGTPAASNSAGAQRTEPVPDIPPGSAAAGATLDTAGTADATTRDGTDPDGPGIAAGGQVEHASAGPGGHASAGRASATRKVLALGGIAFVLLMAEGVAADWSALQLRDRLDVEVGTAGLAFAAFSATMTAGRFGADRVAGRFGPVAVLRWGTLLAAAGFALITLSGWLPLTILGWALCGIGLAGGVPQVFTAAGNLGSSTSATDMSRVFGLGYVGLLAGPAIIGWLTQLVPLTTAMVVPLLALLLCGWGARAVAGSAPPNQSNSGQEQ
ncbi:MFS transporter [Nocardia sp. NPDC057668]|uniref:MFS transporter n=1 Tax=Nocardia sp. NPDC057668 TaxID=3346202 RepID=UPI0036721A69